MIMKKLICSFASALFLGAVPSSLKAEVGDTLWFDYSERSVVDRVIPMKGVDSIEFRSSNMTVFNSSAVLTKRSYMYDSEANGSYTFNKPGRLIVQPSTYLNNDYTKTTSQFCFQRSVESEHFIIFWENGITKTPNGNISYDGYTCNVNTLIKDAEKIWKCYVDEMGFVEPGNSTTDLAKIHMYIVKKGWGGNNGDWRADGSGVDGLLYTMSSSGKVNKPYKVGVFHCTPRAATARNGHTVAHEIGHTFQYLVSADLGNTHGFGYGIGQGNDNEWWEDCANWQAYKVYPSLQYSDGEYYEGYLKTHHLNIHHEDIRYNNCFYQDYWCQLHGKNTIARIWRETKKPEDPTQTYMRLFGLNEETFGDEMYQAFAHLVTIDIDGVRNYGKAKIGAEPQRLIEPSASILSKYLDNDKSWWVVDPQYCPENYGYNANPLKVPAAGTVVTATFKGIAGCEGYGKTYVERAGWRYGLVAYSSDGTRTYSDVASAKDGEVSITVPEKCTHLWFVVMGAPTKYWSHSWTSGVASSNFAGNGEQWPYAVKFSNTDPYGAVKTYGEYPEDYVRKDTTVVINASLAYSGSAYSSVRVQYDMDAVSQALGVSTQQMKAVVVGKTSGKKNYLRFAGLNTDGKTETNRHTTSTSSSTCYGHWFNSVGNVCDYGSSSYIFAEMYPDSYGCYVGQYPGRLTKNKTYVIRQAYIYTDNEGKEYKAIMETHLTVL